MTALFAHPGDNRPGTGMDDDATFDVIVIGAGSAGCVLAARLSEDASRRVLLVEAGGEARGLDVALPVGYARLLGDRDRSWGYATEPEAALGGRVLDVPAGRMIGGTGSLNGMLHVRGHPADYDGWRAAGNAGWGWDDVRPWFERVESPSGGPLAVAFPPYLDPVACAWLDAAAAAGYDRTDGVAMGSREGAGRYAVNVRRGARASSATAYLAPARTRPNLLVRTRTLAERIVLDRGRAIAVDLERGGTRTRAHAAQAIVLAAGAFNSPQLLQRSGIGDPAALAAAGIEPAVALRGVGSNLQNHYRASLIVRARGLATLNTAARRPLARAALALRWFVTRGGPLAVGTAAGGFFRSLPSLARPDLQMVVWNYSVARRGADGVELHPFPAFTVNVALLAPASRGDVRITSADPRAAPRIAYRHLAQDAERRTLAAGLALARGLVAGPPLARIAGEELAPGAAVLDVEALAGYAAAQGGSVYHPVGTCRMGRDRDAVVDATLRVHGVEGLLVADASVMPMIPAGNTNAPTLMIAERAAASIIRAR